MKDLSYYKRPKSFDEFVGQRHIFGENAPYMNLLKSKNIPHSFFFGPPGSGKTSAANIIAIHLDMPFYKLNATNFKTEELREIIKQHTHALQKPLIFIDEIHRLSKNQQELLLPIMESREAIIMGASTENPFFALTAAIRSRSMVFEFFALSKEELYALIKDYELEDSVREFLVVSSGGDVRAMLNLLSYGIEIAKDSKKITLEMLQSLRRHSLNTGTSEDSVHYDLISALIKSIRGSDENAAIYYLARLIKNGENAEFIARRLVILASEDIGNANPNALNLANSTMQSVAKIGYPEARIILAQCVVYLCASPKSNMSYNAINKALDHVEKNPNEPIVENIQHFKKGYLYPHDFGGWVGQKYMYKDMQFVKWENKGFEKTLYEWLCKIKNIKE